MIFLTTSVPIKNIATSINRLAMSESGLSLNRSQSTSSSAVLKRSHWASRLQLLLIFWKQEDGVVVVRLGDWEKSLSLELGRALVKS